MRVRFWTGFWWLAALAFTALLLRLALVLSLRWANRRGLAGREELSPERLAAFHSAHPPELVMEIYNRAGQFLGVPAGRLRPTDAFVEELRPRGLAGAVLSPSRLAKDLYHCLHADLEHRHGELLLPKFIGVTTLGDMVETLASLVPQPDPQP